MLVTEERRWSTDAYVCLCSFACGYLNQGLPFGGVKASGYGRFGGPEGLLSLVSLSFPSLSSPSSHIGPHTQTSPRAITSDLVFRYVRTSIPPPLDYPIRDSSRAWRFAQGLALLAGGSSLAQQAKGLVAIIRNSF